MEEEEELPPSTTSGPDAKGVVTKVEYYRNDKGEVMKKTTKTRVVKIEKKVYTVRSRGRAAARAGGSGCRPCRLGWGVELASAPHGTETC